MYVAISLDKHNKCFCRKCK